MSSPNGQNDTDKQSTDQGHLYLRRAFLQDRQYQMDEQSVDLRYVIKVFKKRRWMITVITLLAVVISAFYSYTMLKPSYSAKSLLLVTQVTDTVGKYQAGAVPKDDLNAILSSTYRTPVLTMNTYTGEIKSEALLQRVINKLGLDESGYTTRALAGQISTVVPKDSNLIEVTVNNSDPALAVSIANTLTRELMAMITEKNQELIDNSVEFLQDQVNAIKKERAAAVDPAEIARLDSVLASLSRGIIETQIARNVDLGSTSLMEFSPALSPYTVMPNRLQIIGVALVLGLMLSAGLAFLLEAAGNVAQEPENTGVNS
ncbi:YveK family protein [Pelotomaculum propionicicum]|uniref:YveK family protein n=1 Tax=Pelotomaculum propionicicum TaxID=258475 RepID=UPI003B804C70